MLDKTRKIAFETMELLKRRNITVATAESCTAGMLSAYIASVPGASAVFELGVSAYSGRIKQKILGVSPDTISKYGTVSRQTAAEMATGVRRLSGADIGVSVTGVAGPDTTEGKPVGLIYAAVADDTQIRVEKFQIESAGRDDIRDTACQILFNMICEYVERRNTEYATPKGSAGN